MKLVPFLIALVLVILSWQLSDNGYQWASGFLCALALYAATFIPEWEDDEEDDDDDSGYPERRKPA